MKTEQEVSAGCHDWYVNLVPARYMWEPQVGVGECEFRELVQSVAVQVPFRRGRKLIAFVRKKFPFTQRGDCLLS